MSCSYSSKVLLTFSKENGVFLGLLVTTTNVFLCLSDENIFRCVSGVMCFRLNALARFYPFLFFGLVAVGQPCGCSSCLRAGAGVSLTILQSLQSGPLTPPLKGVQSVQQSLQQLSRSYTNTHTQCFILYSVDRHDHTYTCPSLAFAVPKAHSQPVLPSTSPIPSLSHPICCFLLSFPLIPCGAWVLVSCSLLLVAGAILVAGSMLLH